MNNCRTCRNPGHIEDLGQCYCRSCFRGMIESRIKRSIFQRFRREDRIYIPDAWSGAVLQRLLGGFPLQLVNDHSQADKVVNPASADDLAQGFLQQLSGSGIQPSDEREVLLFSSVTDQELLQYSSLIGVPFTPRSKDQRMQQFFQQLEKYPEIPLNISKNVRALQKNDHSS